jgi:hypothetical protein
MFYVLYPFVTYLLSILRWRINFISHPTIRRYIVCILSASLSNTQKNICHHSSIILSYNAIWTRCWGNSERKLLQVWLRVWLKYRVKVSDAEMQVRFLSVIWAVCKLHFMDRCVPEDKVQWEVLCAGKRAETVKIEPAACKRSGAACVWLLKFQFPLTDLEG